MKNELKTTTFASRRLYRQIEAISPKYFENALYSTEGTTRTNILMGDDHRAILKLRSAVREFTEHFEGVK